MSKSIKRHIALQPISREHREGLSFCLKIQQGVKKKADITQMKDYAKWFWENHLLAHFKTEEEMVFVMLNSNHPMIVRAMQDHKLIAAYFELEDSGYEHFSQMAMNLHDHIRFEERILFMEIQSSVSDERLDQFDLVTKLPKSCDYIKPFWD